MEPDIEALTWPISAEGALALKGETRPDLHGGRDWAAEH